MKFGEHPTTREGYFDGMGCFDGTEVAAKNIGEKTMVDQNGPIFSSQQTFREEAI